MVGPELRAVLVGSFFSYAALAVQAPEKCQPECPRCESGEIGTWDHMMWECSAKPPGPAKPRSMIQRRLCWPMTQNKEYNEAVYAAAEEVVRWTWNHRHVVSYDSSNAEVKYGAPVMDAPALGSLAA